MKKGFTLIELLVVIGVLAILATITVLVINPAERFRQARDVQRLTDLKSLKDAINLYLTRAPSPDLGGSDCVLGTPLVWRPSVANWISNAANDPFFGENGAGRDSKNIDPGDLQKVDGKGWVSIQFDQVTGGIGIAKLPIDPLNTAENSLAVPGYDPAGGIVISGDPGYFYAYQCKGLTYEINANMESQKYSYRGDSNPGVEKDDGGQVACAVSYGCNIFIANNIYEIGNDPGLDL